MTTDERIEHLAKAVEEFQVITRQGFAVLTELHAQTEREIAATNLAVKETNLAVLQLKNSVSTMLDHVADHETRIDRLEDQ